MSRIARFLVLFMLLVMFGVASFSHKTKSSLEVLDASDLPVVDSSKVVDASQQVVIDAVRELFDPESDAYRVDPEITIHPWILRTGRSTPEVVLPLPTDEEILRRLREISGEMLKDVTDEEAANSLFWDFYTRNFPTHTPL